MNSDHSTIPPASEGARAADGAPRHTSVYMLECPHCAALIQTTPPGVMPSHERHCATDCGRYFNAADFVLEGVDGDEETNTVTYYYHRDEEI